MSVPRHGVDCRTRTFPTKCSKCGDEVFFFSCTCGSQVFFDQLGWPWPEHDCGFSRSDNRWARSRPRTNLGGGGVRVEISDGVTATRPAEDVPPRWNIDPTVVDAARRDARSRERRPIESVPPGADWTVEVTGVIREVAHQVDVYRRLKLPRTAVSEGFLGVLGSGRWGRVTIHVLESVTYSYTAWVPVSLLPAGGLGLGVTVTAVLRRMDVAGVAREWACRHFRVE